MTLVVHFAFVYSAVIGYKTAQILKALYGFKCFTINEKFNNRSNTQWFR